MTGRSPFLAASLLLAVLANLLWAASPSSAQAISNVAVSNVTTESFTVSWTTDVNSQGSVRWGLLGEELNQISYDTRGQSYEGRTHYVLVQGLQPDNEYRFEVIAGSAISSTRYRAITAPPLAGANPPVSIFGRVYSSGTTPATEAVVAVRLIDLDGQGTTGAPSQWLSVLINRPGGDWVIPIGNIRTEERDQFFHFSLQGDQVQVVVYGPTGQVSTNVDTRVNSTTDATPVEIRLSEGATATPTGTGAPAAATATSTTTGGAYPPPEVTDTPVPTEVVEPTQPPEETPPPAYPGPEETPGPLPTSTEPSKVDGSGTSGQEPPPPTFPADGGQPPVVVESPTPTIPSGGGWEATPTPLPPDGGALTPTEESAQPTPSEPTDNATPTLSPARLTATAFAADNLVQPQVSASPSPSVWPASYYQARGTPTSPPAGEDAQSSSSSGLLALGTAALALASGGVLGSLWYQAKRRTP